MSIAESEFPKPESTNWLCQCGGIMRVVDSRPTTFYGAHAVRRRRRCQQCRVKVTTIEITRDNPLVETLDRAQGIVGRAAILSKSLYDLAHSIEESITLAEAAE